jgi:hypothetical protein
VGLVSDRTQLFVACFKLGMSLERTARVRCLVASWKGSANRGLSQVCRGNRVLSYRSSLRTAVDGPICFEGSRSIWLLLNGARKKCQSPVQKGPKCVISAAHLLWTDRDPSRFTYLIKLLNPSHLSFNHPDNLEHERDDDDARRNSAEDDAGPAQRCLDAVPGTGGEVQAPGWEGGKVRNEASHNFSELFALSCLNGS